MTCSRKRRGSPRSGTAFLFFLMAIRIKTKRLTGKLVLVHQQGTAVYEQRPLGVVSGSRVCDWSTVSEVDS